jgi:hypothetical protein
LLRQAELAGDARPQGLTPAEEARVAEVEAAHAADQAKWEAMRASLAKRTRAVALISGKLDEMPARPELMQVTVMQHGVEVIPPRDISFLSSFSRHSSFPPRSRKKGERGWEGNETCG